MSNKFQLISANDPTCYGALYSMHNLRYQVFHDELKWTTGLKISRNMEYDEYDCPDTKYIVRMNDEGVVDAACRLIPTTKPYMIADHYADFVRNIPLPCSNEIWELSRFCASLEARKVSKGKVTGQLIAAAIEFGITMNIKNYIALATDTLVPVIKRMAGWDPKLLGDRKKTPDDFSYSVLYTVSPEMLEAIRKKNGIDNCLLYDASFLNISPTQH